MSDTDAFTRVCGQPAADGSTFCQNATNTQWFEGHGWRCRFHMPDGMTWPHSRRGVSDDKPNAPPPEQPDPMPNDGRMATFDDALALINWATREAGLGRISESRARAVRDGATRYIKVLDSVKGKSQQDRIEEGLIAAGVLKRAK